MELTFQEHPDVIIASNTFRNCQTILQFEDIPLLEVGKFEQAGYTTRFPVFDKDGRKIAVVKGSRTHLTPDGEAASLRIRDEDKLMVCELEGKPILELRRDKAASMKGWAELFTPNGILIKAFDSGVTGLLHGGELLTAGPISMKGAEFDSCQIGIHVKQTGIVIGYRCRRVKSGITTIGGQPRRPTV